MPPQEAKPHRTESTHTETIIIVNKADVSDAHEHEAPQNTVLDTVDQHVENTTSTEVSDDSVKPKVRSSNKRINRDNPLYEVIVDTWGSQPSYSRGTIIRASECLNDIQRAISKKIVKLIPEYESDEEDAD